MHRVPVEEVREAVMRLQNRYDGLPQAADATGISYRTLQSVRQVGKVTHVNADTAKRILEVDANPPKAETIGTWDKKNIRYEVLKPHIETLEKHYGSLRRASEITEIPLGTLRSVKFEYGGHDGVSNSTGLKIIIAAENLIDVEPLDNWTRRYVPLDEVRPNVLFLIEHYGSVTQASEAIGIPTSTLHAIEKSCASGVKKITAAKVKEAAENPPDVSPPDLYHKKFRPMEEIRPLVIKLFKHYDEDFYTFAKAIGVPRNTLFGIYKGRTRGVANSTANKIEKAYANPPKMAVLTPWERRFVPTERVTPLVQFLVKVYGTLKETSEVTGVSVSVLGKIRNQSAPGVEKENVVKIVEAVKSLRHGDRTWSVYENEGPPRLATSEEQNLPKSFTRWRHAGGKTK